VLGCFRELEELGRRTPARVAIITKRVLIKRLVSLNGGFPGMGKTLGGRIEKMR
jgi:hypothetical protein